MKKEVELELNNKFISIKKTAENLINIINLLNIDNNQLQIIIDNFSLLKSTHYKIARELRSIRNLLNNEYDLNLHVRNNGF